ncbi:hypothetical protein ACWY4P_41025 [Streptomyces sp. LZ34]
MAGQISMEAALAAFRKKCGDLLEANVLLEARLTEAEAELEQLRSTPAGPGMDAHAPPGPSGQPD